ncbi:MAG: hypothetical protein ACXWDN_15435 [Limisphaerales bacterium]
MRFLLLILFAAAVAGCTRHHNSAPANVALPLDSAKVLAIARHEIATKETWDNQAEFETPKYHTNTSSWSVFVWRLPKRPGGHRLIRIDETGRVTDYIDGK